MLNHRNTIILFILIILGLIGLHLVSLIHWIWFLITSILFISIEFYGAYFVQSGFHIKTINNAITSEKIVALTFDDGPMPEKTENVLKVLNKFNAKATFFCIGNRIKGNEQILQKIDSEGHLIGNHSYSHANMFDLNNTKQMLEDLQLANTEIRRSINKTPAFFRPPYGVTTPSLARACKQLNVDVIGWNVRSLDTAIRDKQRLVERITSRIRPGSIILMHDTVDGIEIALEEILVYLKKNNYQVVALNKLIDKKAYA